MQSGQPTPPELRIVLHPTLSSRALAPDLFDRLPDELLLVIVKHLGKTALKSFAEVNQRFYRICCPFLWKVSYPKINKSGDVELESVFWQSSCLSWIWKLLQDLAFPTKAVLPLIYFTKFLLPNHGPDIVSISVKLSPDWYKASPRSVPTGPNSKSPNEAFKIFLPRSLDNLDCLTPENVIQILSACPRLKKISLIFRDTYSQRLHSEMSAALDVHIPALVSNLSQLEDLGIEFHLDNPMPVVCIVKALSKAPHLKSLYCWNVIAPYVWEEEEESDALGQALSRLARLEKLILYAVNCLNGTWKAWSTSSTLNVLEIISCHNFRASHAARFVNSFSPNVKKMELHFIDPWGATFEDMSILKPHHIFQLPCLTELRLWHTIQCELILCFQTCKNIRRITYSGLPAGQFSDFVDLVCASTWPRLEILTLNYVFDYYILDRNHRMVLFRGSQLRNFCRQKGIQLKLFPCPPNSFHDSEWKVTCSQTRLNCYMFCSFFFFLVVLS